MGLTRPRAYQIFDIDYKQSVRVVTVSNVTLSGGAPSQVDGVSLSLNDRVLVTGQSTGSQNGLYYVTTVGTGSNGTWQRSIDGNETGEIDAGMVVMVTEGLVYADTQWKLITDDPITIGVTALTFTQNYSANSISSGTSNVSVYSNANVTISSAGTPNVLVVANDSITSKGNLLPDANITYSLGSTSQRWKDLWISNSTIYIGETNISATGTTLQVGGTNVVTQTASGNVSSGNISATGSVTAVGNITGNYILGNGALLTGVITSVANINSGTSNITVVSPGGDITVGVGGTSNVGVFSTTGLAITGDLSVTGNATLSGNILGDRIQNGNTQIDIQTQNGNANITVGGVANVVVFSSSGQNVTGYLTASGNITGGNLSGTLVTGTLTTAAQPNITSVGMLSSLTVTGNVDGGNLVTAGQVVATSNITGGNITTAGLITGNGAGLTSLTGANVTGTVANATYSTSAGSATTAGTVTTAAQPNITSVGTLSSLSVTGNVDGGNLTTLGQVTASGNISGSYFIGNGSQLTGIQADTIGGNITILTRATGNVNFAVTAGYVTILTRSGNVAFALTA